LDQDGNPSKYNIYNKLWLNDQQEKGKVPSDFIGKFENRQSSAELKELSIPFDYAKPVRLLAYLLEIFRCNEHDIVLDFFAGSASLSHAVMLFNAQHGKNLRSICVQLPEAVEPESEAGKAGFKTITEIARERIRRAGRKIRDEFVDSDIDAGFKSFRLSRSNISIWNPDRNDLEQSLLSHEEHLVEGRNEQDILYELLLKRGVELAVPIESREVNGKNIYSIGYGVLFACLVEKISREQVEDIAQGILDWHTELSPSSDTHVFFRDSAFRDDVSKTNMAAILEQNGISHVRSL